MIEQLFFELLQVAIGTRHSLSKTLSAKEWTEIFVLSKRQALTAIAFVGIKRQSNVCAAQKDFGESLGIGELLYLNWLSFAAKIAQRNKLVTMASEKACEKYIHDGMRCCVLKGQSNLQYYPEELKVYRTPGDIDMWSLPQVNFKPIEGNLDGKEVHYEQLDGISGTIMYVMSLWRLNGGKPAEIRYHHIDSPNIDGICVETHFRPMYMSSPLRNARLQRWFNSKADEELKNVFKDGLFPSPSVGFDAVYQLTHIYRHFFSEGIGLRQLLDYYFVLLSLHEAQCGFSDSISHKAMLTYNIDKAVPSNNEIKKTLEHFGMTRFVSAVMWVLQKVFAMPSVYLLCEPNENAGRFLLDEIMKAGNFGKYDSRLKKMQEASKLKRYFLMTKRNFNFLCQYPSEVLWDPFRRVYNVVWRKLELWRY